MAVGILMPKAGISVESCIITQWLKKPGDNVAEGEILFSYETDKASFECESTASGTLLEIFYQDGDEVPVLVNVCAVGIAGEDATALRPKGEAPSAGAGGTPAPVMAATEAPPVQTAAVLPEALKISPRAKKTAAEKNVDARLAAGSGPHGRIIERDIRALIENGNAATPAAFDTVKANSPAAFTGTGIGGRISVNDLTAIGVGELRGRGVAAEAPEYEDIAFSGIRRAISKSMTVSLATIPQLTHNFSFDATELLRYRSKLKDKAEAMGLPNITLNDMILYAVSRILPKYPDLNAHMLDANNIRRYKDVNLGMAVDTERGLVVPVLRDANRKSLSQIADEAKRLAKQAQAGTLAVDDMKGGTFTISNLGSLGVESFTPVINPPETGILGVNNIINRVKEVNGEMVMYPAMSVSLTYDHRAIDGAPASRFGKELCAMLADFSLILAV